MPTRRIAERSAALEAVKRLHEEGELDDHLRPKVEVTDSDEEDEVKVEEKKIQSAGTESRQQHYRDEVAPSLSGCFPVTDAGNELYVFVIREASTNKFFQSSSPDAGPHSAFGILTRKPIPYLKVPEFSIYDHKQELCVTLKKLQSLVPLNSDELRVLTECHRLLFTEVLGIRSSWLKPVYGKAEKDYLIVPVSIVFPEHDEMHPFVDIDVARRVAENPRMKAAAPQWPCSQQLFHDSLVTDVHRAPEDQRLYEVIQVDESTTPLSPFPSPSHAATYAEYFHSKYNLTFKDHSQPGLICQGISTSSSRLNLLVSRFKGFQEATTDSQKEITLFPECCGFHPLPASFWKLARCLPSVLWRMECIMLVDALRSDIASETLIGRSAAGLERMTRTRLRGYEDYGFGKLETQCFNTKGNGEEEPLVDPVLALPLSLPGLPLRGPDNALILQALTLSGANDSINLERLETLGDSFLKVVASVHLFCELSTAHEGRLSQKRQRRIGNLNLYLLAKRRGIITGKILSKRFRPREMWIPPCFQFDEHDPNLTTPDASKHYQSHKVSDKGVADCIESLLGAYLVSGGIEAGIRFLKWMGVKICKEAVDGVEMYSDSGNSSRSSYSASPVCKRMRESSSGSSTASSPEDTTPLYIRGSSAAFACHFNPPPPPLLVPGKEEEVLRLLKISRSSLAPEEIQKEIHWTFRDRGLLLQALTHASYLKNRVTDCYQRLEFLGDAVLDYLVTCHVYSTFPKYNPGEITSMRSALVNNVTFAVMAVKLNLHKALLHNSLALFRQIPDFEEKLANTNRCAPSTLFAGSQYEATPSPASSKLDSEDEEDEELDPPKVLGDVFESLAGAVFVDSGMSLEKVWSVFRPLFEKKIKEFGGQIPIPPVQELLQLEPRADFKNVKCGRGRVKCTVFVEEKGIQVTKEAGSIKAAKTAAARAAVRKLKSTI